MEGILQTLNLSARESRAQFSVSSPSKLLRILLLFKSLIIFFLFYLESTGSVYFLFDDHREDFPGGWPFHRKILNLTLSNTEYKSLCASFWLGYRVYLLYTVERSYRVGDRQHDPTEKNLFINKRLQHVSRSITVALTSKLRNIFLRVTNEINLGTWFGLPKYIC